ncbi:hypothetical protein [Synoicihabitans lomoniglobus]|uniref:Uncharacterized protein n=1 Tax=Synoicihabitans lomoniglobus TaxID=2909285 RepID=A0AAF0CMA1_9BACT|nr:hypothetical protein [Opitutaceae bacterium LMO-M01]WED63828.1 hypothetical protein PXH66_15935 [Opitutaceae bacterium LMO-M01]
MPLELHMHRFRRALAAAIIIGSGVTGPAFAQPSELIPHPDIEDRIVNAALEHTGAPGPWGTLRTTRRRLVVPAATLATIKLPETGVWGFSGVTWAEIDAQWQRAPLTTAERKILTDPAIRRDDDPSGILLLDVPPDLRWSLSPTARTFIYDWLATFDINQVHVWPFVLPATDVIERAQLSPRLRDGIDRLAYERANRRCLADPDLLVSLAWSAEELQSLKRLLCYAYTLTVELLRDSAVGRPDVIDYWSQAPADSTPTWWHALERSPELESIDIAHFLPTLPQSLLNTFPDGKHCPIDANCFWISLNFFRRETNDLLLPYAHDNDQSAEEAAAELTRYYDQVEAPYRFGDVLSFTVTTNATTELAHMVVYLADDIVLTKNGAGHMSPFILARLEDVARDYAGARALHVQGHRPRPGSPALPARR